MASQILLLRAINVAGKNKIAMKELALLAEKAGLSHVQTYIQSGNVVGTVTRGGNVAAKLSAIIARDLRLDVRVVSIEASELAKVLAKHPYLSVNEKKGKLADDASKTRHVAVLDRTPTPSEIAKLDVNRSPGDAFSVSGRVIYLHFANGTGKTKFSNDYFERVLGVTSTMRNIRTMFALVEMASERECVVP